MPNSPTCEIEYYTENQDGGHTNINEAYQRLENSPLLRVRGLGLTDPSTLSPAAADGDVVIVDVGASSTPFFGHDKTVAMYYGGWMFRAIKDREVVVDLTSGVLYMYNLALDVWQLLIELNEPTFNGTASNTGAAGLSTGTIYRKALAFGALPNNTSKSVAHGMPSGVVAKGHWLRWSGTQSDGTTTRQIVEGVGNISVFTVDATNVVITTTTNLSGRDGVIFLEWEQ